VKLSGRKILWNLKKYSYRKFSLFPPLFPDIGKRIAIYAGFLIMKAMIQREHLDYPAKVQQIVSVDERPEPSGVDRSNF
jgi:uncharacterized protein involved in cysteine biosynthesis